MSAETERLSKTHAPIGKGGKNWITALKPGNKGQLPAYIQNVRNGIMKSGTPEGEATGIAIGRVRDWAEGKGDVSPEVRKASAEAIAEFDADRAKSKSKSVKEALMAGGAMDLKVKVGDLSVLEAAAEADTKKVWCVKDKMKVTPNDKGQCPKCGTDLKGAMKATK